MDHIDLDRLTGLRKTPTQSRSRARVRRIIEAAEHILESRGYTALTMRDIADEADVPTGTVYQFFTDKTALVDVIVQSNIAGFEEVLSALAGRVAEMDVDSLIDTVFDTFVERNRSNRAYMVIRSARQMRPERQDEDDRNIQRLAAMVHQALITHAEVTDSAEIGVACLVAVQAADSLLALAFRADPHGDATILAEARRIAHLHLADIVARGTGLTAADRPRRVR